MMNKKEKITLPAYPELGIEEEVVVKIPKTYPSEEEVVKLICNSLEENLIKNMSDTTDFKELMEKITKEFLKRYPEKKSKLISL